MNITILTYGSRGDVQPFLPLSLGLMSRGHKVILTAPSRFKSLVEEHGITFFPLAGDPEDLSRRLNDAGYNFLKQVRELMTHAVEIGADIMRQTEEACKDADLIIHTFTHAVGAHTLAREKISLMCMLISSPCSCQQAIIPISHCPTSAAALTTVLPISPPRKFHG